jgi:cytoskeletal protein CcmA (bactofilin family)
MNATKEISLGIIWGALAALIIFLFIFAEGNSAVPDDDEAKMEISISADSVSLQIDKNGNIKSVKIPRDKLEITPAGIRVEDELLIKDGKIFIDGVEITEEELKKLAIDTEESQTGIDWKVGHHGKKYIKRKRVATVYTDTEGDIVRFSDIVIQEDEYVSGDVVSIGGDIEVFGEVGGDVVSAFGDVYLEDCRVRGDVAAPFGKIKKGDNVIIDGEVETVRSGKKHAAGFGLTLRYNRVEGLGLFSTLDYKDREGRHPGVELFGGYAFTLKRWEYDFGLNHSLFEVWSPYIDLHLFQLAESSDRWILTEPENSFAAAVFKEDFYDFYWKRGFSGELGLTYAKDLSLGVGLTAARISNLKRTAAKALFGGDKKFRENWSTVLDDTAALAGVDGDLNEVELKLQYDTRDYEDDPGSGIFALLAFDRAFDSDSAEFEYEAVNAEIKYYYPVASDQTVFFRFRGGYSDDDLPLFRRYFIGGIGSLRGYRYKEFQGNRYILFNSDYIWRFYDSSFGAGVFFDAGKAAFSGGEFEDGELKTDMGISLLIGDDIRINLAQRLDDMDKSPALSLRGKILF